MKVLAGRLGRFVDLITRSGKTIYDHIDRGDAQLWIPSDALEEILQIRLAGISLAGLPLRTRSKVLKGHVCRSLGYPQPASFLKTKPRFQGLDFDTYVQKANNLQIWNEELAASRRYVLIRVNDHDVITRVKVVSGTSLSFLDTTGTLTQKFQARAVPRDRLELVSKVDTRNISTFTGKKIVLTNSVTPVDDPTIGSLYSISEIFDRLSSAVGSSFTDKGRDQERNRGGDLHKLVSKALGYSQHRDNGRFPDILHQILEVKLQTSPTIDLGLVAPNSVEELDCPRIGGVAIRHCDVRYAVFYGETNGKKVKLTHLIIVTGEQFFKRFPQFQGKVLNKKIQIPLPGNFFK